MLILIIFFIALLTSYVSLLGTIEYLKLEYSTKIYMIYFQVITAIIFWTWFYHLSH